MALQKLTSDELLQLFAACLRDGIADRNEESYIAEEGAYILFIEPREHRVSTFSLGLPVITLNFQSNNQTWDSIETECSSFRNFPYHTELGRVQKTVQKEKGERKIYL